MYRYETHLHTKPVSECGRATVRESLEFYKQLGYDGVFITNHFLDGNINIPKETPYEEKIRFYFSDIEEGKRLAEAIGIKVFGGVELSYKGTDFLVYGLEKEWYLAHPEIMDMKKSEELSFMMESGALVIQAHPYRDARYIDHVRLFHKNVCGVEVINASCKDEENRMAQIYAESYGLIAIAGSDNHTASNRKRLAGVCCETPILSEADFVRRAKNGEMQVFTLNLE